MALEKASVRLFSIAVILISATEPVVRLASAIWGETVETVWPPDMRASGTGCSALGVVGTGV
jgi:hypothetical protein